MAEDVKGDVVWPFYAVLDCSSSMWHGDGATPYGAMVEGLQGLMDFAADNVAVSDIARFGIITFSDTAQVALPLSALNDPDFRVPDSFTRGTYTNYRSALELTANTMQKDIRRLNDAGNWIKTPIAFFISDGTPQVGHADGKPVLQEKDEWLPAVRRLHAVEGLGLSRAREPRRRHPGVISMGFDGALESNLKEVYKAPGIACIANRGEGDPAELMHALIAAILVSISDSVGAGEVVFDVPQGMRIIGR